MGQSDLIACFNFARKRKFLSVSESDSNQSQGQTQAFWQFYANRKKAVLPPPTHTLTHTCITHANSHTHTLAFRGRGCLRETFHILALQ